MTIQEAKKILSHIMKQREVPVLVGHAGVGKTEIIKQIGKETKRDVRILVLSQMEPGDLLGLPERDKDRTIWLKPDWFPEKDNTILFLDEINRASDITRAAVMQLLLDRRLNDHVLPEGVWLVAAMNPEADNYEVNQVIDQAFIDRFVWIKVTNNLDEFKVYARKHLKERGVAYLSALEKAYHLDYNTFQLNTEFDLPEIAPTPRAHMRAAKLFDKLPVNIIKEYGKELLRGIVGKKYADTLYTMFVNAMENPLTVKDLLNFDKVRIENAKPAEKVTAIQQLISYLVEKKDEITKEQLNNLARSLRLFKKEHLGQLVRTAQDDENFNDVILELRDRSKEFSQTMLHIISNDVTGQIEIAKVIK